MKMISRMERKTFLIVIMILLVSAALFAAAPATPPVQREFIKATGTLTLEDLAWGYHRGNSNLNYDYLPNYDLSAYKVKAVRIDGKMQQEALYTVIGYCPYSSGEPYRFNGIIILEGELIKGNVFPPVSILLIDSRGRTVSRGYSDFITSERYGEAYRKRDHLLIYASSDDLDYNDIARLDLDGGAGKVTIKKVLSFPLRRLSLSQLWISKDFGEPLKLECTMKAKGGTIVKLNWLDFCKSSIGLSITSPKDQAITVAADVSDGIGYKTALHASSEVYADITSDVSMTMDRESFYILEDTPTLMINLTITEDAFGKTPITTKKSFTIDLKALPRQLHYETYRSLFSLEKLKVITPIISCLIQGKKASVPKPIIWRDKVYVHIRSLFETLGYKVDYVEDPPSYKVSCGSIEFELGCDTEDSYLVIDGCRSGINPPVQELINNQLYMPISVLEVLGMKVSWDEIRCVLAVECK